jgi:CheY-like chemotaxis protein
LAAEASDVLQLAVVTSPNPEGKPPVGGNHGSTEMPAASSLPSLPEPTAEPESSIPGLVNPNGKNEIILVVDDEEVVVTTVAQMLAFGDYKVLPCTGGLKALEHLRAYGDSISLVLLDYTMPVMDGGEVFEAMQKIRQDVAVLLTSGFGEQAKMRSMLMKGLRGFLPEPYEPDKLLGAVRSALDVERTRRTGERRMM